MSLRIYDSATQQVRDFEPVNPSSVGIYVCGLTVQGSPHIGHLRCMVAFDQLRRWLIAGHGYDVTFVRNVTDVDDKIIAKAAEHDVPFWKIAYRYELETSQALDTIGVMPPTVEPRATGHVTEMVDLMRRLIDRGHAYEASDGSGDVYFDVRSWSDYGALTRQNINNMEPATDADPRGKRDPRDFALWKGRPEDTDQGATWPTPWGTGRPGWHLECSAMARRYLGEAFDIHGGGVDLRFPHHENEMAQSTAAGYGFARHWMHSGLLSLSGEKMSKSLGNTLTVTELSKTHRPIALRYYLGSAHYRSTMEYSESSLAEASTALARIEAFVHRVVQNSSADQLPDHGFPDEFRAAMDDDLNVAGALAVVHDTVRVGNSALDAGDTAAAQKAAGQVVAMADVIGFNPLSDQWHHGTTHDDSAMVVLDAIVQSMIAKRQEARAAKDFATADALRDEMAALGIEVSDGKEGATWSLTKE